jgi:hypothetical protein
VFVFRCLCSCFGVCVVFRCLAPISPLAHRVAPTPPAYILSEGGWVGWVGWVEWVGGVGRWGGWVGWVHFWGLGRCIWRFFNAGVVADAARKSSAAKLLASVGLDGNAAGDLYMGASGRRVSIHKTANLFDMVSICLPPCLPARQCAAAPATVRYLCLCLC